MELNFNSVETIPVLNASAAFKVDSGKVFKEDVDIVHVIIDETLSYVPWDGDNEMPYDILKLIEGDEPSARQSLQHKSPLAVVCEKQTFVRRLPPHLPDIQCRGLLRQRAARCLEPAFDH